MSAVISREDVLDRLHRLPVLPLVIQQVIASFRNPSLDSAALARKIAQDQGLSAKILRVANSTFYGLPRKVGSVQDAMMVLGLNSVRSLALAVGFRDIFPHHAERSSFDRDAYWRQSFRVAGYAQVVADCLRQGQQMAFAAGSFHNIGQIVLDVCLPEQFSNILEQQRSSGQDLMELEQSILGFDHAVVGADLARRWNFPPEIERAIRGWRMPERESFEPVTSMVYVAVLLERGLNDDELMVQLPAALCDRLGINWERIQACLPEQEQIDACASLMVSA